jgi:glycosyltransferase involved in cell wall biosynthesis
MPVLHVVVPVYNEGETLERCLQRVVAAPLPPPWTQHVHLVDDHSADDLFEQARRIIVRLQEAGHCFGLHRHEVNLGKGAALQTGFDAILNEDPEDDDLVVIQDADLEYDPSQFRDLMEPILAGRTRAVLGTRWGDHAELRGVHRRVHAFGNRALTWLSNAMTGLRVTDMECCYKVMTVGVLARLRPMLTEQRFGIEPQIVAGLACLGEHVEEVPIRYAPRGHDAGKKIGWRDAARAVWVIGRERFRGRCRAIPVRKAPR